MTAVGQPSIAEQCWISNERIKMLEKEPTFERVDPRVKRTRALITSAFMELLSEKEFQAISVQDITERAEINRSTFYAHYVDKHALLETCIAQTFRQELETKTLNACHYSRENLRALIITVCEFIAQMNPHRIASDTQFEVLVEKQVRNEIKKLLELWLVRVPSKTDPATSITAASWAIYGLALQWNQDKQKVKVDSFVNQILPQINTILQLQ